nr:MAG TPA: Major head protein [Caudoviricetes sp.]
MQNKLLTGFNLQRFAEDDAAATEQTGQSEGTDTSKNTGDDEKNETKKLSITQDELDEILNKRLARQEEKLKKEYKVEKEEELRKSKLSQAEKEAEERQELQDELAKAKEENRLMKLESRTSELLTENELPQSFKGFLIGKDEETTEENIKAFQEVYRAEIKKATEEKWKSKAPGTAAKETNPDEAVWGEVVNRFK